MEKRYNLQVEQMKNGKTHIQVIEDGKVVTERESKRKVTHVTVRKFYHKEGHTFIHFTYHSSINPASKPENTPVGKEEILAILEV